jgi:hypothetical protein
LEINNAANTLEDKEQDVCIAVQIHTNKIEREDAPNGCDERRCERIVGKPQQKARLADTCNSSTANVRVKKHEE